jgi:hypothetical protein
MPRAQSGRVTDVEACLITAADSFQIPAGRPAKWALDPHVKEVAKPNMTYLPTLRPHSQA